MRNAALIAIGTVLVSCAPLPPIPFVTDADIAPPVITDIRMPADTELHLHFDEEVELVGEALSSDGAQVSEARVESVAAGHDEGAPETTGNGVAEDVGDGGAPASVSRLRFTFAPPPAPGVEHYVEAQVRDEGGNNLRFLASFYGKNALLPAMIINELTTQGSGNHPDLVEIRVLTDGNLAGAVLYEGVPETGSSGWSFRTWRSKAGDYVVVHFRPEGTEEEINETARRDTSGGLDSSPEGWDFWVEDGSGLSGNNGVISLCENPFGGYLDVVVYSNRTSESDERYRGFGSRKVMERADAVFAAGAWSAAGVQIAPEDAVNPDPSTGTRSMVRGSDGADTDSASDWHITPTRGLSPGLENTDEVYEP